MNRKTKTKKAGGKDEVEELLQAAQDDMLLKLSLDSHISRGGSVGDADIDRRFQALKLKSTTTRAVVRGGGEGGGSAAAAAASASKSQSKSKSQPNSIEVDAELKAVLGDDLSTRFAALKSSVPMPSSFSTIQLSDFNASDDDNEEDEVEKLIRWAKDAALLGPSPPSDDDKSESDNDDNKSESEDDDDGNRKGKRS